MICFVTYSPRHVCWAGGPGFPGPWHLISCFVWYCYSSCFLDWWTWPWAFILCCLMSSPFFWQYCLDQWAWYYQGPGLIFRDCWAGGLGFPGPWHFIFRICLSPQKPLPCVVPYRKPCSGIRKTEARDATYRPAKGANCFLAVLS